MSTAVLLSDQERHKATVQCDNVSALGAKLRTPSVTGHLRMRVPRI
jgi:hypothetical protein